MEEQKNLEFRESQMQKKLQMTAHTEKKKIEDEFWRENYEQ